MNVRAGGLVVIAGGVLVGLAAMLPIQTASISVGPVSMSQPYDGPFGGPAFLVAGAILVLLGLVIALGVLPQGLDRWGPIVGGAAVVLMALMDLQGVGQFLGITSTGLGWFSAVGGGVVSAAGGVLVPAHGSEAPRGRAWPHVERAPGEIPAASPPSPAPSTKGATVDPAHVPGLLRELAELRDAGVISAAEFEAKKATLLERM